MSETYEFGEARPVKRAARIGAGRRKEPNPFEAAVKAIAGQKSADGEPVARVTTFTLDAENGETLKQRRSRIRRFLTRAGKEIVVDGAEPLDIRMDVAPVDGQADTYTVTFWHRQD